jgi:hypothetical protein
MEPIAIDQWVAGGGQDLHMLQASITQFIGQPGGRGSHIGSVLWEGANAREAQEGA